MTGSGDFDEAVTILDGAMGTQLIARGAVGEDDSAWAVSAIRNAPDVIREIHQNYATAGARVHTANTFRTQRRWCGNDWRQLTSEAIELTREAVPMGHLVAGSFPPLNDCYRPDLSPPLPEREQREFADALAESGCDLILCETHCHAGEAISAVQHAVATGVTTWLSLTAGPDVNLLAPSEMVQIARRAEQCGAQAILVNCTPAADTLKFLDALADADLSVPIGAYANAGSPDEGCGWHASDSHSSHKYADDARAWLDAGASIIGGCCGVGPDSIKRVSELVKQRRSSHDS